MFRWGCLLLGFASIVMGIVGYAMHPSIATDASELTVTEAVNALHDHDRIFVTVAGRLDMKRRIYSSLCERPLFAGRPTDQVYEINASLTAAELQSYLGNHVQLPASLGPGEVLARVVTKEEGDESVRGERIFSPVVGSGGFLWAVSPLFDGGDPRRQHWGEKTEFSGVLTRFDDISENIGSYRLELNLKEIRRVAEEELSAKIPNDALLLIDDVVKTSSGHFRVPIIDSGDAIFVMPFYEDQTSPSWADAGSVQGLMWVWPSDTDSSADLEGVLGHELPERYGVIHHDETADDHNRKTTFGLKLFTGLGGGMLLVAMMLFLIRRKTR